MAGLQVLENKFSGQGFHVLGFLSDDFGDQGGTSGDGGTIDACTDMYHVTFPQFQLDHVVLPPVQPVFAWLYTQPNPGPAQPMQPIWNFGKWLVSRHGVVTGHWATTDYPGADPSVPGSMFDASDIVIAIEAELAKP
jgi:glutathione peroxidase